MTTAIPIVSADFAAIWGNNLWFERLVIIEKTPPIPLIHNIMNATISSISKIFLGKNRIPNPIIINKIPCKT
jgi:hypothetical protein